jgi:hypothetical protein
MFTITFKTKNQNKITHHNTVNETNSENHKQQQTGTSNHKNTHTHTQTNKQKTQIKEYVEQQKQIKKKKFTTNRSTSTRFVDLESQIK